MTASEERPAALDLHADDAARDLRVAGDVDVEVATIVAPPIYLVDNEAMTLKQRPYRVDAASLRPVADAEALPWRRVIVHTATLRPMTDSRTSHPCPRRQAPRIVRDADLALFG